MVKRIQNTIMQAITDAINLMLLDKGLGNYVNNFTLHMLPPTTQEEIDRRENLSSKIQIASDIMNTLSDVEDPIAKVKILKSLLSTVVSDNDIIQILQDYIEVLESEAQEDETPVDVPGGEDSEVDSNFSPSGGFDSGMSGGGLQGDLMDMGDDLTGDETVSDEGEGSEGSAETILPSPADLELDLTDNNFEA